MAHKQLLHDLLQEDQEPFRLKSYIADRKSLLNKPSPSTTLQIRKSKPIVTKRNNLSKHACFLSFQHSPDVRKSPFRDFPSPAKSPRKSQTNALFLHIPTRTAALLVEAAMRIQKQPRSQAKNAGFGFFGSFLKRIKERSKNRKRVIGGNDFKFSGETTTRLDGKVEETIRISCSNCSNRRLSSAYWTENNEDKSLDFEASTSSCGSACSEEIYGDFDFGETRFCASPFRFSLRRSPSSSARRTPDFTSPVTSPNGHAKKENDESAEEGEEKEQCSPVSILDTHFEGDGRERGLVDEEDDYDLECTYANVQRTKEQLLYRLRRFERLAELDPIELERKLLEECEASDDDEPLSLYEKHSTVESSFVSQVLSQSSFENHSRNMSADIKRLVSDLIVEEMVPSGANDVMIGRICKRFDSWKEVEFNTIDMMVGSDLKTESDGWRKFYEQVQETATEVEVQIFAMLIEQLSYEFLDI